MSIRAIALDGASANTIRRTINEDSVPIGLPRPRSQFIFASLTFSSVRDVMLGMPSITWPNIGRWKRNKHASLVMQSNQSVGGSLLECGGHLVEMAMVKLSSAPPAR